LSAVVADTHSLIWFLMEPSRLSPAADAALRGAVASGIHLSAISIVEVVYLVEKSRLPQTALERIRAELAAPSTALRVVALDLAVAAKLASVLRTEVPDMPDRIVAATALHLGLPLVSRDRRIRASSVETVW